MISFKWLHPEENKRTLTRVIHEDDKKFYISGLVENWTTISELTQFWSKESRALSSEPRCFDGKSWIALPWTHTSLVKSALYRLLQLCSREYGESFNELTQPSEHQLNRINENAQ